MALAPMSSTATSFCPEAGESVTGVEMLDEVCNGEVTERGHGGTIMARDVENASAVDSLLERLRPRPGVAAAGSAHLTSHPASRFTRGWRVVRSGRIGWSPISP